MARINRAYELLADSARRAAWDAAHPVQVPRPTPSPGTARGSDDASQAGDDPGPTLEAALEFVLAFGKFRGRTLGYVAASEPGYIAWIVRTLRNRPEVVRHARVVLAHLEASGWRDTSRPPRSTSSTRPGAGEGQASGAGRTHGTGGRPGGGAVPGSAGADAAGARPMPRTSRSAPRHGGHDGLIGLGLAAFGVVAWIAGIPPETASSMVFLAAIVGWPLWMVVQNHLDPLPDSRRTGPQAWRAAVGEVVFVAVLLAIGWAVLQGILEGPQPGDIVCEVYDPRLGDCVVERLYEGE